MVGQPRVPLVKLMHFRQSGRTRIVPFASEVFALAGLFCGTGSFNSRRLVSLKSAVLNAKFAAAPHFWKNGFWESDNTAALRIRRASSLNADFLGPRISLKTR